MAGRAFELAQGYISLSISTKGMGKEIVEVFAGADKAADVAGKKAGKKFAKAFGSQADDLAAQQAIAYDKAAKAAEAASKKVAAAKEKETAAAAKLNIALKQEQELKDKGKAKESQLAAAAEKVRVALERQKNSARDLADAEEDAADKHRKLKQDFKRDIHGNIKVDVSEPSKKEVQAEFAFLTRNREVDILPKVSKVAFAKAAAALGTLSGLSSIQKSFQGLQASVTGMFQSIPKIAAVGTSIAGLGVMAGASAVNMLSLASSIAAAGPALLLLPGLYAGAAAAAGTLILALKDAPTVLSDVVARYKTLQKTVSQNFWAKAEEPIRRLANEVLPSLRQGLGNVSSSLGGLFASLADAFRGKLIPDLQPMFTNLAKAIDIARAAAEPLAEIVATLGKRGAEYLPRLSSFIVDLTTRFNNFLQAADKSGQLTEWIENALVALQDLGRVAQGALGIVTGLMKAATAAGGSTLKGLADAVQSLAATINSPEVQESLTSAFKGLLDAADRITTIAGPAVKQMFVTLGATAGKLLPQIGTAFGSLVQGVAQALSAPGFQKGLLALGSGLASGLKAAAPWFTMIGNGVGALMGVLGTAVKGVLPLFAQILGKVGQILSENQGPLQAIVSGILGLANTLWKSLQPAIDALRPVFTLLLKTVADLLPAFAPVFKLIGGLVSTVAQQLAPLLSAIFPLLASVIKAVLPVVSAVIKGIGSLISALLPAIMPVIKQLIGIIQQNMPALQQVFKLLAQVIGQLVATAVPVIKFIGKIMAQLLPIVMPIIKVLVTYVIGTIRNMLKIISGVLDVLKGIFTGDFSLIKKGVTKIWKGLWDQIKLYITAGVKLVKTIISGLAKSLYDRFRSIHQTVIKIVKKFVDAIKSWFTTLKNNAITIVKNLWTKVTDRFRSIRDDVKTIISKMVKSVQTSVGNFRDNVVDKVKSLWTKVTDRFRSIRNDVKTIISKMISAVQNYFANFKTNLVNNTTAIKDTILNKFRDFRTGVKNVFSSLVDGVQKMWERLKGVVSKPIKTTIDFVNTKLIKGGINWLLGKLGVDKKSQVPWIPTDGFATGGWTGPGAKYQPAGIVHADEYVLSKDARRKLEDNNPGALDYMNQTGRWPGYAHGGMVSGLGGGGSTTKSKRIWPAGTRQMSPNYSGHSGLDFPISYKPVYAAADGSIAYTGTGHGYGQAIFEKFSNGLQAVYGHLSKYLVKAGQKVTAGQQIAVSGNTGRSTGPHLHFEINSPGAFGSAANRAATLSWLGGAEVTGSGGGVAAEAEPLWKRFIGKFADPIKWLTGKIVAGTKSAILGKLGSNPLAKGLANVPGLIVDKAKSFLTDKFGSGAAGSSAQWSGASVGSLSQDQLNNAATIIATAKNLGFGQRGAIIGLMTAMQESTLRNLSGGDRDSVGLFQQRAPWGPFADRHNPAKAAAMFYNGGQGGQPGLRSKDWKHMGLGQAAQAVQVSAFPGAYSKWEGLARQLVTKGYAGGTISASRGPRWVGERGPELVNFRGGERVYNHRDSMAMAAAGGQGPVFNDCQFGADPQQVAVALRREQRKQMAAVNLTGVA